MNLNPILPRSFSSFCAVICFTSSTILACFRWFRFCSICFFSSIVYFIEIHRQYARRTSFQASATWSFVGTGMDFRSTSAFWIFWYHRSCFPSSICSFAVSAMGPWVRKPFGISGG